MGGVKVRRDHSIYRIEQREHMAALSMVKLFGVLVVVGIGFVVSALISNNISSQLGSDLLDDPRRLIMHILREFLHLDNITLLSIAGLIFVGVCLITRWMLCCAGEMQQLVVIINGTASLTGPFLPPPPPPTPPRASST